MKIVIDSNSENARNAWTLTGEKFPSEVICLTITFQGEDTCIYVSQSELIKMINILVDNKNG